MNRHVMTFALVPAATLAMTSIAAGQQPGDVPASAAPVASAPAEVEEPAAPEWTFSTSAYTYIVPGERDYIQPTLRVDRDLLHLEARYNYEDLDTGSAWIGCNFSLGKELTLDFTPMLGGVFGDTTGIAPGYEFTLTWRNFELYSEGEWVFDTGGSSDHFFYAWSELTWAPTDWLRAGLVMQRTRAYQTDLDIQRGFLVGLTYKSLDFTVSVLNPDESRPIVVLGLAFDF